MSCWRNWQRVLGAALAAAAAGAMAAPAAGPQPSPTLDPAAVVRIQLEALAHNDEPAPDAGLAVAYRFASPDNRAQTGPLAHFAAMIHGQYAHMLNHRSVHLEPAQVRQDRAVERVELVDRAGRSHRFVFLLSRQNQAPYAGCWMTDGVLAEPDQGLERGI